MRILLLVTFLVACSSETSNPLSTVCETAADCTDPARPYCVQGACHGCDGPSACTAELPRCSLDELVCSACMDDSDCALHTDTRRCGPEGACVGCVRDDQCDNPLPVCDTDLQSCRGCEVDAECESMLCETATGECTPEDEILYAAPSGAVGGDCTRTDPCSLDRAVTLAMSSSVAAPTVLMLPGTYTSTIAVSAGDLKILAREATLERGITLTNAQLTVRGLEIENAGIVCGVGSTLVLEDVAVRNPTAIALQSQGACDVRARRTELTGTESVHVESGGYFRADQVTLHGDVRMVDRGLVSLINTVLEGTLARGANYTDITAEIRFSTVILREQQFLDCRYGTGGWGLVLQNSIVYSRGIPPNGDVVYSPPGMLTACSTTRNLLYPQTIGAANPMFVDLAIGDYRLQASSPAIDEAMPTAGAGQTDHDHAGTPRPQGSGYDIGAFERLP